jgi:ribosomal protein L7/L12
LAVIGRCRVVLLSFRPGHKILVIKRVREATGLGLKEAKDLVESAPRVIKDNLTIEEGEQLVMQFEWIAQVSIEPQTSPT